MYVCVCVHVLYVCVLYVHVYVFAYVCACVCICIFMWTCVLGYVCIGVLSTNLQQSLAHIRDGRIRDGFGVGKIDLKQNTHEHNSGDKGWHRRFPC